MFNALTFDKDILKRTGGNYSRVFFVGEKGNFIDDERVTNFLHVDEDFTGDITDNVYLSSMLLDGDVIDRIIEHTLSGSGKLIISACRTLDEVGTCDKRFGVTPIGLAHKYGLLENNYVCGATYLDKDDVDLIVQSNATIILTPSMSLGHGEGIPPLRMMLSLGANVRLGTGERKFNEKGDLSFESKLIALAVSGALCTPDAISSSDLQKMLK